MHPRRYVDIHVLQTIPYANLNRDDLGSPKSVLFGGAERIRVSSQCWKRAVRGEMEHQLGDAAVRTRRIGIEVSKALTASGWAEDLATHAGQQVLAATASGLKVESDGVTSSVLLYLPEAAIAELANLCQEHRDALEASFAKSGGKPQKKKDKGTSVLPADRMNAVLSSRNGIINLFGRMLAEMPSAEVDGAVQVAHAFTTHGSAPQVDFFTAVDDLLPPTERGSGHMNSAEFSAGVFYRYASVNVGDLMRNTGDAAATTDLTRAFLNAFIASLPHAKKNSTAPFTVPDLAYVVVRSDRPVSFAAAFEAPVRSHDAGYAAPSRDRLGDYATKVYKLIKNAGQVYHAHATVDDDDKLVDKLGNRVNSFQDLVDGAINKLNDEAPTEAAVQ